MTHGGTLLAGDKCVQRGLCVTVDLGISRTVTS